MTTLDRLGAAELGRAIATFGDALSMHQEAINRLNVYPVPDGDTGTNMTLTLRSVAEAVAGVADEGMAAVCKAIAHGSLMGARGNSGVILSQLLRGMTEVVRDHDALDGEVLAAALTRASELSYEAVQRPVEGTILTVVRESAEAARGAAGGGTALVEVLARTRAAGQVSLDGTPELLAVLKEAGVVDAGGAGFLLLLDALLHVVDGREVPAPPDAPEGAADRVRGGGDVTPETGKHVSELRYEVMYLLEAPDEAMPAFREVWAGIGDSIVVVGGDGIFNCHIHTDDIGPAIEAAIEIGRPRQIRVTDLLDELHEIEEERWVREAAAEGDPGPEPDPVPCGVVAVATGEGIRRIFGNLRVQQVVTGGQSMNPSTAQLLEAVEAVPAPEVVILPNNKNIIAVAEQVDALTAKTVRVLPTRSITEGFAALLAYDPQSTAESNVAAMREHAEAVVNGEITQAVRDSTCDAGPIAEGDWLGISRDGIQVVAPDLDDAACQLLDRLLDDHELVTIIEGDGASPGCTRHITQWLEEHHPDVEAEVHHGGQPLYPYLFGIE
ncbi:DAK2 domain-containing protein [Acidimicrobiia bacterium EGI L10123]|uniref:DAK2 domain-containing protein n=1 Tax=Salinilacustrithrix flava TaxID=2957203 RepID=UPI003D7C2075|nr:DAK2 domain-containing protein [Acidimicrobiia bacterium EGI L10123]